MHYLRETSAKDAETWRYSGAALAHLDRVRYYEQADALVLDPVTVRNLELVAPIFAEDGARGAAPTLLSALDETGTGMGARLLRQWILRPQVNRDEIEARLDAVQELKTHTVLREEIRQNLARRAGPGAAGGPRDAGRGFAARSARAAAVARPHSAAAQISGELRVRAALVACMTQMDELADVRDGSKRRSPTIRRRWHPIPASSAAATTPNSTSCANFRQHSRQIIAAMEERERKRTGIGSLKIRFNQVFGYYIEISNANLHLAPADFERKQTLVNAERFTTPELKEYERKVLAADERIAEIERRLFIELRLWIGAAGGAAAAHRRGRRATRRAGKFRAARCCAQLYASRIYRRQRNHDRRRDAIR